MAREVELFAEKVERLCDFLIEKLPPGDDRNKIDDLRQDALAFQVNTPMVSASVLEGIGEVVK